MEHVKRVVCLIGLVLAFARAVKADNTACTGAIFMVPDGSVHEGTFTASAQSRWYRFVGKANRSYMIVSENLSPGDFQTTVALVGPIGPNCAGAPLPSTRSNDAEPAIVDLSNVGGSDRKTLLLSANTEVFFAVLSVADGGLFRVRVEESTMFSPAWSTNGDFDTFYSYQNTTKVSISGTLTLFDANGSPVDSTTAVIPASGTLSTNTAAMATPRNQMGVAVFTHNGPIGALLCEAAIANFTSSPPYVQTVKCQTTRQQR